MPEAMVRPVVGRLDTEDLRLVVDRPATEDLPRVVDRLDTEDLRLVAGRLDTEDLRPVVGRPVAALATEDRRVAAGTAVRQWAAVTVRPANP